MNFHNLKAAYKNHGISTGMLRQTFFLMLGIMIVSQIVWANDTPTDQKAISSPISALKGWDALRKALRQKSDRERAGLRGAARSVIVESEVVYITPQRKREKHIEYDIRGNILEQEDFFFTSKLSEVRAYNSAGDLVEKNSFDKDVLSYIKVYSYNADGSLSEVQYSNADLRNYRKERHRYDSASNRVEITTTGDRDSKRTCDYKISGERIEVDCFNHEETLMSRVVYDKMGHLIEEIHDFPFDVKDEFTYDESGYLIETSQYTRERKGTGPWKSGGLRKVTKVNDSRGNVLEATYYDSNDVINSKVRYAYEFDVFGNWTKQTQSGWSIRDGKRQEDSPEVRYRTISYY